MFKTIHYSQPEAYRFSHDSVFLARRVFDYIQQNSWTPRTAMDVCAGCGVIGLDLIFHLNSSGHVPIKIFDFLDVQNQYEPYFWENVKTLNVSDVRYRFLNFNYADYSADTGYDLIVCNPPYFDKNQGKLPPSALKQRSRFFIDSDLKNLIQFVDRNLSNNGKAFILIRDQSDHKLDHAQVIRAVCRAELQLSQLEDIRGTHLFLISKN